ncbi:MAG: hypothetical protein J6V90_08230 [Treponema sp.]|nr:hypothetical protein [Treponema sp.]
MDDKKAMRLVRKIAKLQEELLAGRKSKDKYINLCAFYNEDGELSVSATVEDGGRLKGVTCVNGELLVNELF